MIDQGPPKNCQFSGVQKHQNFAPSPNLRSPPKVSSNRSEIKTLCKKTVPRRASAPIAWHTRAGRHTGSSTRARTAGRRRTSGRRGTHSTGRRLRVGTPWRRRLGAGGGWGGSGEAWQPHLSPPTTCAEAGPKTIWQTRRDGLARHGGDSGTPWARGWPMAEPQRCEGILPVNGTRLIQSRPRKQDIFFSG